ncbi:response regulator [Blastochloris viridis]|uniref:DNA-binding response regulator PetR n=1 Tax=Blastochloris viridis TaxID=1079 RepID=A0A0H5BCD2_BLAVI|nr:response regulator [Blastochloris viridis]ALK10218.1 Transcriptional regulatory protein OmpR [Blastochloris viridis]BAR99850.1 DNA-binding response regulator PetR [Blastochloris viridis]CUU42882.1 Transcriptional regulatory protein OmpR [Blastochloris viridis]
MPRPIVVPPDDAPHLLVVDDDARILALLQRYLTENGYRVTTVASAAEARAKLESLSFDLLVLDVMMPGESGLDLARGLRGRSDVPILMLTARTDPAERIAGLESGADDYLGKPFEPRELLLRIGAILKRISAPQSTTKPPEAVRFGDFVFMLDRGELKRGIEAVRITERERDMLRALARAPGETVPRTELAAPGVEASERAVDVQVNRLRRKIEDDPANPLFIQTVRGIGYRLVVAP